MSENTIGDTRSVAKAGGTVTLPDGYNGSTVECYREPVAEDGDLVKLRTVRGLIKWVRKTNLQRA